MGRRTGLFSMSICVLPISQSEIVQTIALSCSFRGVLNVLVHEEVADRWSSMNAGWLRFMEPIVVTMVYATL